MNELPGWRDLMNPVLNGLRSLGGSARPGEVNDWIVATLEIPDDLVGQENQNKVPTLYNRVAWARFYLAKAGYVDSSQRGVWALTEKGADAGNLGDDQITVLLREVQQATRQASEEDGNNALITYPPAGPESDDEALEPSLGGHRERVKVLLRGMSPSGFERFCQRLLREAGFERVEVTGKSGDEGIDGRGVLRVNPLASFNVVFQCKRYKGTVGSPEVRNFRGAMEGRADRGLLLTPSQFSRDAEREAARDGVMPIELVDGDGILDLLEQLQLGLSPVSTFNIDPGFFEPFMDRPSA